MLHFNKLMKVILYGLLFNYVQIDSLTTAMTKTDKILVGYDPYLQKNTSSVLQCVHLCLRHRPCCCKSINIISNIYSKTFQCQILNYTIASDDVLFTNKPKSQHIQLKNSQLTDNQLKNNQTNDNQTNNNQNNNNEQDGFKQNCLEWKQNGHNVNGIYEILLDSKVVNVSCDMVTDGGGWIIFQNRFDGSVQFNRSWDEYKNGFGTVQGEFWLGNEFLHQLSRRHEEGMEFWIEGTTFTGDSTHRKSKNFFIGTEQEFYKMSNLTYLNGAPLTLIEDKMIDNMNFSTIIKLMTIGIKSVVMHTKKPGGSTLVDFRAA